MGRNFVYTFGRFDPPTMGHKTLFNSVLNRADELNAECAIYVSPKTDGTKTLLDSVVRKELVAISNPSVFTVCNEKYANPFNVLNCIVHKYDKIVFVIGSDRYTEFKTKITNYAIKRGMSHISIESCCERTNDTNTVNGISSSYLKRQVALGNKLTVMNGLHDALDDDTKSYVFDLLHKGINNASKRIYQ